MQNENFLLQFFACVPLSFKIIFNNSSPQSTRITILTWIILYQWPYFISETTSRNGILRLLATLVFNISCSKGQKLWKELTGGGAKVVKFFPFDFSDFNFLLKLESNLSCNLGWGWSKLGFSRWCVMQEKSRITVVPQYNNVHDWFVLFKS